MHIIDILGKHTDSLLGPMNHWWVVHASGTINIQKQANQTWVGFQCHSQSKKRIGHCWHPPKSEFDQAFLVSQRWAQTAMMIILFDGIQNLFPAFGNRIRRLWSRIAKALGRILVASNRQSSHPSVVGWRAIILNFTIIYESGSHNSKT